MVFGILDTGIMVGAACLQLWQQCWLPAVPGGCVPRTHARAALWPPCECRHKARCAPSQPPWQLVAGEQIDHLFGAKLGLSVLASAGLGNMVADVVGVSATHTIQVCSRHRGGSLWQQWSGI